MGIVEQFEKHLTNQPGTALLSTAVQTAITLTLDAQSQQLATNKNNWKVRYPKKADENATATTERLKLFSELGENIAKLAQHVQTKYQQSLSSSQAELDRYISRHRDDEQATFAGAYSRELTVPSPSAAGAGAGTRAATDHGIETLALGQGDHAITITAVYSHSLAGAMSIYNQAHPPRAASKTSDRANEAAQPPKTAGPKF